MYEDTQDKGDHAELRIASALKQLGWTVLFPYSESKQYDIVAEREQEFVRIQVKSSIHNGSSVVFPCYCSNSCKTGSNRTDYTSDDIDGFGVYNSEYDSCYWVPLEDANKNTMALNTENANPRNPASEYRFADRFE
jgi:hypothetical protein